MASTRTVAGSGYGNKYIDSLIWGGAVWDTKSRPITYYFGEEADLYLAKYFHHGSLDLSYWDELDAWSATEKAAFEATMTIYSSVCKVTFQESDSVLDADMVWWQGREEGIYGAHEIPSSQSWGV